MNIQWVLIYKRAIDLTIYQSAGSAAAGTTAAFLQKDAQKDTHFGFEYNKCIFVN